MRVQRVPRLSNNLVSQNKVSGNGRAPMRFPSHASALRAHSPSSRSRGSGNCFEKNKPSGFTCFASTELDFTSDPPVHGELPTDGCREALIRAHLRLIQVARRP